MTGSLKQVGRCIACAICALVMGSLIACESAETVDTHPGNYPPAMHADTDPVARDTTPWPDYNPVSPRFNEVPESEKLPVID